MTGEELLDKYQHVREETERRVALLSPEDMSISSMEDVSPTKWHLAHTTWFWERFVLTPLQGNYKVFKEEYSFLFNSYYVQAGERHCRAQRGLLSRPSVAEILQYRWYVDERMEQLLLKVDSTDELFHDLVSRLVTLGLNHEQQHQELMLTDIQHVLWKHPFNEFYNLEIEDTSPRLEEQEWVKVYSSEVPQAVGVEKESKVFHFDNEGPRHRVIVPDFEVSKYLVTNREWLEFIEAGGYNDSRLWLAAGYKRNKLPLYWKWEEQDVWEYTLGGWQRISERLELPVRSISYYEADAYARFVGARLPTEFEWEVASWQPQLEQLAGSRWQWTASPYLPYPGYQPVAGPLGEYNGKWMCDQWVLRGGSFATPAGHTRRTYRNFWPAATQYQYTGLRLAK